MTRTLVVIAHNLRSAHNVGALFRTAEGLGVQKVYLTGYTPYPPRRRDKRLPHESTKVGKLIAKTALGTEALLSWQQEESVKKVITSLKKRGFCIVALEQTPRSIDIQKFQAGDKVALVIGNEPQGIDAETLKDCDECVEIPMRGQKESFNVVQAAAIALYQFLYL